MFRWPLLDALEALLEREQLRALEAHRFEVLVFWLRWGPHAKRPLDRESPAVPRILKRRRRPAEVDRGDS